MAIPDDDFPIVVFASGNYMEAQFVASVLNGSDVAAFVLDDNVCRIYAPAAILVGGAKVLVSAQDVERSQQVLAGVEVGESPITEHFLSIPLSEPAALITLLRNWLKRDRQGG